MIFRHKLRQIQREINRRIAANKEGFSSVTPEGKKWLKQAELEKEAADGIDLDTLDLEITEGGYGYKVELAPKEDEYLLWDRPVSEQPKVEAALSKRFEVKEANNQKAFRFERERVLTGGKGKYKGYLDTSKGGRLYQHLADVLGSDVEASKFLLENGIRGVKFLDFNGRHKGTGTHTT